MKYSCCKDSQVSGNTCRRHGNDIVIWEPLLGNISQVKLLSISILVREAVSQFIAMSAPPKIMLITTNTRAATACLMAHISSIKQRSKMILYKRGRSVSRQRPPTIVSNALKNCKKLCSLLVSLLADWPQSWLVSSPINYLCFCI